MKNGHNRTADTVLYEKNIGEKSYYAVQAVPDTKAKTLYVVTAFIGQSGYKNGASQLINANGPNATSKSGSASAPIDSISRKSGFVNSENLSTPVGQARNYAKILKMGENGIRGLVTVADSLASGVDLGEAAIAFNAFYNQGKNGKAFSAAKNMELLSPEQRQYAYNLGIMDKALDGARKKSSGEVLQNNAESGKINNNKESAENEQGIRLRDGSERDGGQDPGGQVSGMEGGTGQDSSGRKAQRRPADAAAASGLDLGEEVDAQSLGLEGGLDSGKVRLIKDGSENESMVEAKKLAEEHGLEAIFFAGGDLHILKVDPETGKEDVVEARGYIEGNRVYIRVDHPRHAPDQIMRHEICHDMIDNGEIDVNEVRERIKAQGVDVEYFIDRYSEAYALSGAIMGPDDVWIEIICDSYGDMNEFASVAEFGKMNAGFLSSLKGEVEANRKDARGPPKSTDGRASRELYVFPPYDESQSDANEIATRWAHRKDVKTGDCRVVSYHGDFYLIEKFDDSELDYQIVGKITKKQYNHYIKEYQTHGENFTRQSSEESSDTIGAFDRERNWSGGREHSSDFASVGHRRKDISLQQMGEKQSEGRSNTSDRSGSLQGSSKGVERTRQLNLYLPVKQKFVDVSGLSRNVLGIGNGQYMVQGTQTHNYEFNSIEEAISAENENIIQRYARKTIEAQRGSKISLQRILISWLRKEEKAKPRKTSISLTI